MVYFISLFFLALAVSLDSFTVGFTYGMRKIKIPLKSIAVITGCSAITMLVAMAFGELLLKFLPIQVTETLGGLILIAIGGWILYQFFSTVDMSDHDTIKKEKLLVDFEIKTLGIVIKILHKPMSADIDKSGSITGVEAVLLGFALSLDAFGAGIGAALLGYSPIAMALVVAVMSSLFVTIGMNIGLTFSNFKWMEKLTCIPGFLLIMIGLFRI
ncbi:sporulation membrane protein YtaF [Bacillus carboniphilus]|uniref:Sporulation membrane protein YtaF n=1 Tax=Bacillus carboniphilus TaxID=86663 RepID=A0ABY9K0D6_9BACI|nr:sporulation membrane protein YtaF [Bacillus carboniphilus]WLR44297.1 sporulation membrane protein YtaF [Bacillus carboniphilus]